LASISPFCQSRCAEMIVSVGIDIVDIDRFRKVLERQGERFVNRVFTAGEQDFCRRRLDVAPHYAARFAAKEALFKALGTGWARGVTWLDAEVKRAERGAPEMVVQGQAGKLLTGLKCRSIHISLSHSEVSAIALVILET
jgi:holo-[acyl-carrier protein] synthase